MFEQVPIKLLELALRHLKEVVLLVSIKRAFALFPHNRQHVEGDLVRDPLNDRLPVTQPERAVEIAATGGEQRGRDQ